jgi:hypothetical protein
MLNELDVVLASVDELRAYMWMKRKCGREKCARLIRKLRKDLVLQEYFVRDGRGSGSRAYHVWIKS